MWIGPLEIERRERRKRRKGNKKAGLGRIGCPWREAGRIHKQAGDLRAS